VKSDSGEIRWYMGKYKVRVIGLLNNNPNRTVVELLEDIPVSPQSDIIWKPRGALIVVYPIHLWGYSRDEG